MAIDGMSAGEVLEGLQTHLYLRGWSDTNIAALCDSLLHAPADVQDRGAWVDAAIVAKCVELGAPELVENRNRRNTRPGVCGCCGQAVAAGAGRFYWREGAKRETALGATYYSGYEELSHDECPKEAQ